MFKRPAQNAQKSHANFTLSAPASFPRLTPLHPQLQALAKEKPPTVHRPRHAGINWWNPVPALLPSANPRSSVRETLANPAISPVFAGSAVPTPIKIHTTMFKQAD
jgi:hypothetical protein